VIIALLSLWVAGIPLVASLGYASAVAVLTAVVAAITLLPAILSLAGGHLFGARLPAFLRPRPKPAAAIIMISVFGGFILNGGPTIKQFGVGLSVAVLLAAAMVLSLAPALLTLFGAGVWWLPRWLDRVLPHVNIEGEDERPAPEPTLDLQPWLAASGQGPPDGVGCLFCPTAGRKARCGCSSPAARGAWCWSSGRCRPRPPLGGGSSGRCAAAGSSRAWPSRPRWWPMSWWPTP
jgi:hypothetical protein